MGNAIKIEIESGIKYKKRRNTEYPFAEMKVGDSFAVKVDDRNETSVRSSTHTMAKYWAYKNKKDWIFATAFEADKAQIRIWRTK